MTSRDTNLNVNVTATDRATPTVRGVASEVAAVEGTHTVDLDAAGNADDALAGIRSKLDGLTDSEKTIVLKAQTGQLERDVARAEGKLRDIHKLDGDEIRVVLDARDNASKKLDAVRTELRQLDGDTADVRVDVRGADGRSFSFGGLGAGVAAGAAAAGAGIAAGAQDAANLALSIQQVADLTGSTLDQASRLVGVFGQNGVEASDLLDMLLNVNQVLRQNPELAQRLGIDLGGAETVAGRTADQLERGGRQIKEAPDLISLFVQAVDGIGTAYDDAGERGVASSTLFGEEGVRQVQAVKTAINGDLAPALEQFKGPIITDESVENARKINTELAEAKGYIQEISVALLPIITGLLGGTVNYFKGVYEAGQDARGWWDNHPRLSGGELLDFLGGADESDQLVNNLPGYLNVTRPPAGQSRPASVTHIYNPPGTPAATNQQQQTYLLRNGVRLS